MPRPLLRDRRDLGRSTSARFHRDSPTGSRVRAQPSALLVGPPRWNRESQWRANALAHRQRAVAPQRTRFACTWPARMGCRAVPIAKLTARLLGNLA